jgi:hypothetical protein
MIPKEKAISLVDSYRIILMNEDTDCGEEILCTVIAKKCALIAVDEIYNSGLLVFVDDEQYWHEVKQEIEKI